MHLLVPATGESRNIQTALIQQLMYFSLTLSRKQVSPGHYCSFSHLKLFVPTPCLEYTPHPSQTPACNPNCCNLNSDKCTTVKCKVWRAAKQKPRITTFFLAYMLLGLLLELTSCSHSTSTLEQTKYAEHIKPSWQVLHPLHQRVQKQDYFILG